MHHLLHFNHYLELCCKEFVNKLSREKFRQGNMNPLSGQHLFLLMGQFGPIQIVDFADLIVCTIIDKPCENTIVLSVVLTISAFLMTFTDKIDLRPLLASLVSHPNCWPPLHVS